MNYLKNIVLVFLGGATGTVIRYLISLDRSDIAGLPLSTFIVNIAGSFLIGAVFALLLRIRTKEKTRSKAAGDAMQAKEHENHNPGDSFYSFFGTGFLGGFTTYSLFAIESLEFIQEGNLPLVLAYGFGTVVLGVLACLLGIFIVGKLPSGTGPRPESENDSENRSENE